MSIVWKLKKRYKRKTKQGIQWVQSHKQRYTIKEKTSKKLIGDDIDKDKLINAQLAIQFGDASNKPRKRKRKKKGYKNE